MPAGSVESAIIQGALSVGIATFVYSFVEVATGNFTVSEEVSNFLGITKLLGHEIGIGPLSVAELLVIGIWAAARLRSP